MAEKSLVLLTANAAEVTSGRIQVGAVPGDSAQVTVPACCAPVAAGGILPKEPPIPVGCELLALLPQAASAVAAARASTVIMTVGRGGLRIDPFLSWSPLVSGAGVGAVFRHWSGGAARAMYAEA